VSRNLLLRIRYDLNYIAFTIRKGSKKIALIKLKIPSMVMPIILKGSSNNHTIGNRKIMTMASGQQITNNRHHSTNAIKVFIVG
jgi:hypothetical protein